MEVNTSAILGAMRVGIQIVSTLKRPSIEIYSHLRTTIQTVKYRVSQDQLEDTERHDSHVAFFAVNVGGRRAENVSFDLSKTRFERPAPLKWGERLKAVVPVMSPGQSQFLFLLDSHEFDRITWEGNTGTPTGWKEEPIIITVRYDGPRGFSNGIPRWFSNKVRKRKQYEYTYEFNPLTLVGDLPPVERI